MIVKEKESTDTNKVYEIYEEIGATTTDGKKVTILSLVKTTNSDELALQMIDIDNQIASLNTQKVDLQKVNDEIGGEK